MKQKKCLACESLFAPVRPLQRACSPFCALSIGRKVNEKKQRIDQAADRKQTREKLEKFKKITEFIAEAQKAFNAVIRERDKQAGYACISSGRPLDWSGNETDAGHYRSTGAASHLRFNEDNCHSQSKHDNRYLSGNMGAYRMGLIVRIGLERVEKLEADNYTHKWTREELMAIKAKYVAKLKELKAKA